MNLKIETEKRIHLPDIIGKGYKEFWNFRGRYRVVKGSRGSKKSKTTAIWFIYSIMRYPGANAIAIRKVFETLRTSCYAELRWAIKRLEVTELWRCTTNPLEMTYIPTGQKIYFRGLDDPLKLTSIAVEDGNLCFFWLEEAYEVMKEADFDIIDESLRGALPPGSGLFKQWTITFNPWNERHWLKSRFFDVKADESIIKETASGIIKRFTGDKGEHLDTLAITTTYLVNEWLDKQDEAMLERTRKQNPRRYQVVGLGNWGVAEGLIYENFDTETLWNVDDIRARKTVKAAFGLDFGYTNDPTALFCGLIDTTAKELYVFDEIYERGLSNERIYAAVAAKGYAKEIIVADCAEPKSIDRLRELGLRRISASKKGADSINAGIDFITDYKIYIHPRCVNFITEISNYMWATDKFGNRLNKPVDADNHLMDAMRYALERYTHTPIDLGKINR